MLKILIVCKDIPLSRKILNNLIGPFKEFKLIGIAITEQETLEILEKMKPELVISTESKVINLIKDNFRTLYSRTNFII